MALVTIALGVGACGRDAPARAAERINLTGAGATFPYPLYRVWFAKYGDSADVSINYFSVGSAEGRRHFDRGDVDFGAVDAQWRPAVTNRTAGCGQVAVPMVQGPIAVAYNLPSLRAARVVLDARVMADIYLGRLTRWNAKPIAALNPSLALPSLPITVVHRSSGSGTGRAFSEYLRTSGRWLAHTGDGDVRWPVGIAAEGNEGVASDVQVTEGAIGFMELAYARQNHLSIASLVAADGGSVQPGRNGQGYPITTRTWLLVDPSRLTPARGAALVGFARWALREGAAIATELEYDPLTADTIAHYDSILAAVRFKPCDRRLDK